MVINVSKMFLLFSHILTEEQIKDAKDTLKITEFISLPQDLQNIWSNISPEGNLEIDYFEKIERFLLENKSYGDYILIQGDYGSVYYMVNWSLENKLIPVYSTTNRIHEAKIGENGAIINRHIFKHVTFRRYIKNI